MMTDLDTRPSLARTISKRLACALLGVGLATASLADTAVDQKFIKGFMGSAAVVLDEDWQELLADSNGSSVNLTVASEITPDDRPTLVLSFSPPDLSVQPQRILCKVEVLTDKSPVLSIAERPCFEAMLTGAADNVWQTELYIAFTATEEDVGKEFRFLVSLRDPDRRVLVPLSVSVPVVEAE